MSREPWGVTLRRARAVMAEFRSDHKVSIEATQSGKRYVAVCACGYRSTTRSSAAEAVRTGIWHLSRSADEYDPDVYARDGVSLPETVSAAPQDRDEAEHAPLRTVKTNPA